LHCKSGHSVERVNKRLFAEYEGLNDLCVLHSVHSLIHLSFACLGEENEILRHQIYPNRKLRLALPVRAQVIGASHFRGAADPGFGRI
jgi:hypothetical protein